MMCLAQQSEDEHYGLVTGAAVGEPLPLFEGHWEQPLVLFVGVLVVAQL